MILAHLNSSHKMRRLNLLVTKPAIGKLFFSLIFFVSAGVSAAVIAVQKLPNRDFHLVVISGDIERSDAARFTDKINGISNAVVILDSPGGSVIDGILIGKSIRNNKFATAVPENTLCASSCALIWLAGTQRFAEESSVVGFHAAYVYRNGKQVEIGVGNALIGSYLNKLGLSDRAVIFVTSAPPEGIERLDRRKANTVGIAYRSVKDPSFTTENTSPSFPASRSEIGIRTVQYDPIGAVSRFYKALSIADGNAAAAVVIPEKRGIGPFNERNIATFFGSMQVPLSVDSIQLIDRDVVQVRYSYRHTRSQCVGVATITTEYVLGNTLIKGIRANC